MRRRRAQVGQGSTIGCARIRLCLRRREQLDRQRDDKDARQNGAGRPLAPPGPQHSAGVHGLSDGDQRRRDSRGGDPAGHDLNRGQRLVFRFGRDARAGQQARRHGADDGQPTNRPCPALPVRQTISQGLRAQADEHRRTQREHDQPARLRPEQAETRQHPVEDAEQRGDDAEGQDEAGYGKREGDDVRWVLRQALGRRLIVNRGCLSDNRPRWLPTRPVPARWRRGKPRIPGRADRRRWAAGRAR